MSSPRNITQSTAPRAPPLQSPLRISVTPSQLTAKPTTEYLSSIHGLASPLRGLGFYEADRILKAGQVKKRKRRTKTWGSARLVLRPTALSLYKDQAETQLRHQIKLSDITSVALKRDKKGRDGRLGLFDLFTPARNFHLDAGTTEDAKDWVDMIRREATMNEDEVEATGPARSGQRSIPSARTASNSESAGSVPAIRPPSLRLSSSPVPQSNMTARSMEQQEYLPPPPRISESHDPSATDMGSFSDFSDEPIFGSVGDLPTPSRYRAHSAVAAQGVRRALAREVEGPSSRESFYMLATTSEDERVICHGYLRCLKTHGVRQWKKYWVVLRGKSLALYKSEEEYRALLLLPLSSVVDAVETDPLSHRRKWCFQVITEDRNYRFAAADEDELSQWLGGLKSALAKKPEA